MVLKPLEWSPKSLADIFRETAYYSETASPFVADALTVALEGASLKIQKYPMSFRPGIKEGTREYVIRDFPLTIVFKIKPGSIEILRIWHQSSKYFNR